MIQLDIDPQVEQQLVDAARVRGIEPSAYASKIVADAVAYAGPRRLTNEEFRASLDRLAEWGKDLPRLPDYAYTRECFYEDHD